MKRTALRLLTSKAIGGMYRLLEPARKGDS
jgi:hypothetical protein